jgi:glycosyltransferase involved in cell wall biosynthesis
MKILIIISSLSAGGAERFCTNMANHWNSRGREVTVVTIHGTEDDFYCLNPSVKRIALNLGIGSTSFAMALMNNLRRISALRKVLRSEKAVIALSLLDKNNILLALAGIGLSKPWTIGSERIHPAQMPISRFWGLLRQRSYGLLDAVVVLAQETAKWVAANTNARRIEVIQNPIVWPMERFSPMVPPPPKHGFRLLAAGRLHPQKQFRLLISAFCQLAAEFPDWELTIVGEGQERSLLQDLIRASPFPDRVILAGRVGNIGDWYQTADLFVMTSLSEGFPNSLIEAMAHGVPAISFDCDTGPRDIIRHGINGLLVPPGDVPTLVSALRSLMGDKSKRTAYAAQALEVREFFSMHRAMAAWEALFSSLGKT